MRILTNGVIALLATSGIDIGDATKPDTASSKYAVLYPVDQDSDGDLGKMDRFGWWEFSLISAGATREQAEGVADTLRAVLDSGTPPTVAGYRAQPIRREVTGAVSRDDDIQPPTFYCADVFSIFVSPA
jgi:hypothetical protein